MSIAGSSHQDRYRTGGGVVRELGSVSRTNIKEEESMATNTSNTKWQELFEDVLQIISEQAKLKKPFKTKTGYAKFMNLEESEIMGIISTAIKVLKSKINEYIPNDKNNLKNSKSRGKFERHIEISTKRYFANQLLFKLEDPLERSITAAINLDIYNQCNILSGVNDSSSQGKRGSVDIIDLRKKNCLRIIELKQWGNKADNPLIAMLEALSYYYALKKMIVVDDGNFTNYKRSEYRLHVLAPSTYYEYWGTKPNSYKKLENIMNAVLHEASDNDVIISNDVLEMSKEEFANMIRGVKESYNNISEENKEKLRSAYLESIGAECS